MLQATDPLMDILRPPESQFDSGVWSESVGSSDSSVVTEETKQFDKLLDRLDSIGDSIGSKLDKNINSNNTKEASTSEDTTDPEDIQIRELLLSKLAKYRCVDRENKTSL